MASFYIAGRISAIPQVREIRDLVISYGHKITFDWTVTEEDGGEGGIRSSWKEDPERARILAEKERDGVNSADILILNLPDKLGGVGCWVEYGMAAATEKPLWIVRNNLYPRDSVFFYLPEALDINGIQQLPKYLTLVGV